MMKHSYDELAEEGYSTSHYTSKQIFEIFEGQSPEDPVLDIGSGYCTHSLYLKEKGFNVIAIDVSAVALSKAKTSLCRVCADAQCLPFKSNVFGKVLCLEVLEHLPNPEMCMRETQRVLTDGGNALFTTPVFSVPFPKIIIPFLRRLRTCNLPKNYHLHVFKDNELAQMIRQQLTIVKITRFFQGFSFVSFLKILNLGRELDHFLSSHHEGFHPLKLLASGIAILAKK